MVLLRVELQELLHADVGEAERVGPVPLVAGGVYLTRGDENQQGDGTKGKHFPPTETHPDSLHHEADVANVLELGALVDGVNGLDVAGDLEQQHTLFQTHNNKYLTNNTAGPS